MKKKQSVSPPVMSLCPDASGTVVEGLFRYIGRSKDFIGVNCKDIDAPTTRGRLTAPFHFATNDRLGNYPVISTVAERSKRYIFRPIRLHSVALPDEAVPNRVTGGVRDGIILIACKELGVRESSGNNDGRRVEEYLQYTGLPKGYDWCAAFVSWCYGQAGLAQPRNPWSPALFPKARTYWKAGRFVNLPMGESANLRIGERNKVESRSFRHCRGESASTADVFGIYSTAAKRINHVGLVKELSDSYFVTVEGNSNDRVESRRRHLRTIYALADWTDFSTSKQ